MTDYPKLVVFIAFIVIVLQVIYSTATGLWLIAQFAFPITSGFLIFIIGFMFLGFIAKIALEIIGLIGSLFELIFG